MTQAEAVPEPRDLAAAMEIVGGRPFGPIPDTGSVLERHGPNPSEADVDCLECAQPWPCDAARLAFAIREAEARTVTAVPLDVERDRQAEALRDLETYVSSEAENGRLDRRIANAIINKVETVALGSGVTAVPDQCRHCPNTSHTTEWHEAHYSTGPRRVYRGMGGHD